MNSQKSATPSLLDDVRDAVRNGRRASLGGGGSGWPAGWGGIAGGAGSLSGRRGTMSAPAKQSGRQVESDWEPPDRSRQRGRWSFGAGLDSSDEASLRHPWVDDSMVLPEPHFPDLPESFGSALERRRQRGRWSFGAGMESSDGIWLTRDHSRTGERLPDLPAGFGPDMTWHELPDSTCPPASSGCDEGEECPPIGRQREGLCDEGGYTGPFVVVNLAGDEGDVYTEILEAAGCLLSQNWDLALWAFSVVYGTTSPLGGCFGSTYYLVPMVDVFSCPVAQTPQESYTWLDFILVGLGLPALATTGGVTFFCLDNPANVKYLDVWPGAPDEVKLCVAVDVAATILHEMLHACGVVYFEGTDSCDPDIRGTYLVENTFKWAMFQRYPSALQATCCRRVYAPRVTPRRLASNDDEVSDGLFMNSKSTWIHEPC